MCSLSGVYFLFRYIRLFRERLLKKCARDNPEKVIMVYDQYTVPDDCSC